MKHNEDIDRMIDDLYHAAHKQRFDARLATDGMEEWVARWHERRADRRRYALAACIAVVVLSASTSVAQAVAHRPFATGATSFTEASSMVYSMMENM